MIKSYMSLRGYIAFLIEWNGVQSIMISIKYNIKLILQKESNKLLLPYNEEIEKW